MAGETRELWPDSLDVAKVGRLSLSVIKRSGKYGIRLKDPESQYRREFLGIEYYPAREEYKIAARFVADPKKMPILNILGQTEEMQSPGYVVFRSSSLGTPHFQNSFKQRAADWFVSHAARKRWRTCWKVCCSMAQRRRRWEPRVGVRFCATLPWNEWQKECCIYTMS